MLVPTRQRVARLQTLIDSFVRMTTAPDTAELVFKIDADDTASAAFFQGQPWTVVVGPRMNGYRSLPLFFDAMRAVATGDLFMTGNDDMVFQTPDWSTKVLAVANRYPDGLFNLGVQTFNASHFPFSIVSKRAVEAMGTIHHPDIFWGDVYLRDIFETFGRAVLMPDVQVDHDWAGNAPDATFTEARQRDARSNNDAYWAKHRRLVHDAVDRLRGALV